VKGVDLKNFKIKVRTVARLDELFQLVLQG
jgi:hypothetical protein